MKKKELQSRVSQVFRKVADMVEKKDSERVTDTMDESRRTIKQAKSQELRIVKQFSFQVRSRRNKHVTVICSPGK